MRLCKRAYLHACVCAHVFVYVCFASMLEEFQQHKGPVTCVAFSMDGSLLYSAGADGNLCVYDALQGYTPMKLISSDLPDEAYVLPIVFMFVSVCLRPPEFKSMNSSTQPRLLNQLLCQLEVD